MNGGDVGFVSNIFIRVKMSDDHFGSMFKRYDGSNAFILEGLDRSSL
jgi:hypothetical protein